MTLRPQRVASLLKRAVQETLARGVADPRIRGVVTVTDASVTPDLKEATIFVSVLPEDAQELTMHGLRAAAKHIRHEVSERTDLRATPRLRFKLDDSLKRQAAVLDALRREREHAEDTTPATDTERPA